VTDLTDLIDLKKYHINENADLAEQFKVDKTPGLVIASTDEKGEILDYGIRFAGIPSGHEFTTLIQDLLIVSARNPELTPETMAYLDKLEDPIHLQVFVTPTCPYCPQAVVLAHRLAFASDKIQAEMVETSEFMDLARKYQVSGVPDTSINHGARKVVGAVPENNLIEEIQQALAS
jgi:glutaredoxin-like protein